MLTCFLPEINVKKKSFSATCDILASETILNKVKFIEYFLLRDYKNLHVIMFIKSIYYTFFTHFMFENFKHLIFLNWEENHLLIIEW